MGRWYGPRRTVNGNVIERGSRIEQCEHCGFWDHASSHCGDAPMPAERVGEASTDPDQGEGESKV